MTKPVVHIDAWLLHEASNIMQFPNGQTPNKVRWLTGWVTDHPVKSGKRFVRTSPILKVAGNDVYTFNTHYVLGEPK